MPSDAQHRALKKLREQDADVVITDEDRIAYWKDAYDRMAARNGDLLARIAELEAALKPFAEIGRRMGRTPITRPVSVGYLGVEADGINSHARSTATVADFRAARDVLQRSAAPRSPSKGLEEEATSAVLAQARTQTAHKAPTWDEAVTLARRAIYDTDGRGMIARNRNYLQDRVAREIRNAALVLAPETAR